MIELALFPQVLRVSSAYHKFGFKLFAEVAKREAGKNVFLSPHSTATVLSILYLGAAGDTRRALGNALQLEDLDPEVIHQVNRELRRTFSELPRNVELILANSVWLRTGLEFKSDFLGQVEESFRAEIRGLDFSEPRALAVINQWAATNTKGKISHIVDQLNPQTVMALMNALYFRGQWSDKFDPAETRGRPFHLPNGKKKLVPMMSQSGSYSYCEGKDFQAVMLPYGDGRFGLYLFLPQEGRRVDAFLEGLHEAGWKQWMHEFDPREGEIVLPRFRIQYWKELKDVLIAMGIGVAFDPERADLQGIRAERDLFINQMTQKAFVEVSEEGTEAAAATLALSEGAAFEQKRFKLVADRPFFFAIRDRQSRVVLFMGVVNDPS